MVRFDQGYLDGLLSLRQRRALTEREERALASMLEARTLMLEQQKKHRERQRRHEIVRQQIREQDGR